MENDHRREHCQTFLFVRPAGRPAAAPSFLRSIPVDSAATTCAPSPSVHASHSSISLESGTSRETRYGGSRMWQVDDVRARTE